MSINESVLLFRRPTFLNRLTQDGNIMVWRQPYVNPDPAWRFLESFCPPNVYFVTEENTRYLSHFSSARGLPLPAKWLSTNRSVKRSLCKAGDPHRDFVYNKTLQT